MVDEIASAQHAAHAHIQLRAPFALERWTPVSGQRVTEYYTLLAHAYHAPHGTRCVIGVEVEGMTACPCAQMMMHEQGLRDLAAAGFPPDDAQRALAALPAATHNQRGKGRLLIGVHGSFEPIVSLNDLVEIIEQSMSSETYELLKRPDEFFVVNKAHRNPRFVEDVVRGIVYRACELYSDLPSDTFFEAAQTNDESIHKHDAIALAHGTLGEFQRELAGAPMQPRSDLETWLRGRG
jgi:GTP cyclohydrolase-4